MTFILSCGIWSVLPLLEEGLCDLRCGFYRAKSTLSVFWLFMTAFSHIPHDYPYHGNKRMNFLWYNQNIKIQNKPVYYKEFYKIGIHNISDFFDEKGGVILFIAWVEKGLARCHWLKWYGIVQAIKQHSPTAFCKQSISSTVTFVMASKDVFQCTTKDICICINERNGKNTVTVLEYVIIYLWMKV